MIINREPIIKDFYKDKKDFIKDFLLKCKWCKEQEPRPNIFGLFVGVENECWEFHIYVGKDNCVSTDAVLFYSERERTVYPRTTWGGFGNRWDYELKAFLSREICKV